LIHISPEDTGVKVPRAASHSFSTPDRRPAARRNTFGDPMDHSGRKQMEYASPYLEFLDKSQNTARRMPQPNEFDRQHTEGTRFADRIQGERILNEVIYECQRSLEEIGHAKLDQEARSWAKGMGLRE
jgi:hypothetical protein